MIIWEVINFYHVKVSFEDFLLAFLFPSWNMRAEEQNLNSAATCVGQISSAMIYTVSGLSLLGNPYISACVFTKGAVEHLNWITKKNLQKCCRK